MKTTSQYPWIDFFWDNETVLYTGDNKTACGTFSYFFNIPQQMKSFIALHNKNRGINKYLTNKLIKNITLILFNLSLRYSGKTKKSFPNQ